MNEIKKRAWQMLQVLYFFNTPSAPNVRLITSRRSRAMAEFEYSTEAELFP
jgi:hypothetical protein